jgi:serpin B
MANTGVMRGASLFVAIMLGSSFFSSPAQAAEDAANLEGNMKMVGDATNALGLDLYRTIGRGQENLAFSPLSSETALALTSAGARGATAEQMAKVLHCSLAADQLHPAFGELLKQLTAAPPNDPDQAGPPAGQLTVANALWAQQNYSFQQPFLDLAAKNYAGGLHRVDFAANAEAARQTINDWVAQQTHDKIRDLIASGAIDPQVTRMILTNAVYFRAPWSNTFKPENTRDGRFYLARGGSVIAPLMHQKDHFSYLQGEGFQAIEMRYAQLPVTMTIFLPDRADGLPALEKLLTPQRLNSWEEKFEFTEVRVTLPRFKVTSSFQLGQTLASLGMADAFDPQKADFSGIASQEWLFLADVIHKAYVDVNEKGTEAAAATGMMFGAAAMAPSQPRVFNADHPFLFMIRDQMSGAMLFLGRVNNPKGA